MKCPKCSYVSHDYLDACRKCGVELVSFKQDMGLLVLQPGVLDLGLVLGETGTEDLFESMQEEVTRHTDNDGDFNLSLDEYPEHPETPHVSSRIPQAGGREPAEGTTGLDHLTLELDVSALSTELLASLPTAQPETPPRPPGLAVPPPAVPAGRPLPEHVTLDIEPDSGSITLPSGALAEFASLAPRVSETAAPPADRSETTESSAEGHAEDIDDVASVAEVSGAMGSVSSQDIVFVEATPVVPEEAEPARDTFDAPDTEEGSLWLGFELAPDMADSAAETSLMDLVMPTIDDAALAFTAEHMPPTQPSPELPATADEATPEDPLTPSDISALEDLGEPTLPRHLALELSPPETGPEQGWTAADVLPLEDPEDTALPGHLTLDLDVSELMADWASATLDDVQRDAPPGDEQSEMPPPQHQAGDAEELLLDLDDVELDDDTKA